MAIREQCGHYPCSKFSTMYKEQTVNFSGKTEQCPIVFHFKRYALNQGQVLFKEGISYANVIAEIKISPSSL